ncbi:MAG: phenylalanine--tRNA ligase subunit beta, partial [Gemmatimonadales bacterium]
GPPWAAPVFGFELGIDAAPRPPVRTLLLPVTPAAERDLALVLPDSVVVADVMRVIASRAGELLESVNIFDEFRGGDFAPGTRSVGFRLTFRAARRTLTEAEINAARSRVLGTLEKELGVQLRET